MEKSKIHRNFNYSFLLHVFSKHTVLYCNLNRYADFILIFFPSIKTKKLILMNNVCHILQIDIGILFCSFSFLFFFLFFLYIYIYIYIYTHIYIYTYTLNRGARTTTKRRGETGNRNEIDSCRDGFLGYFDSFGLVCLAFLLAE